MQLVVQNSQILLETVTMNVYIVSIGRGHGWAM